MEKRNRRTLKYIIAASAGVVLGAGLTAIFRFGNVNIFNTTRGWSDTGFLVGIILFCMGIFSTMAGRARIAAPYGGSENTGKPDDELRDISDDELSKKFMKQHIFGFNPLSLFLFLSSIILLAAAMLLG